MREIETLSETRFRYEPDTGFLCFVHSGSLDQTVARQMIAEFEKFAVPGESVFILADNRNATDTTASARKIFAQYHLPVEVNFAGFGAPFAFRTVVNMLFKAMLVVSPRFAGAVFAEEAEARNWLAEKRRAYLAKKGRQ